MFLGRVTQVIFSTVFVLFFLSHSIFAQSVAEWQTSMGMFRVELREDLVPITAGNFIDLANANFYDGLIFHRVIDDFMIQDGCPNGNGSGGPGYTIIDEFHPDLRHDDEGVLSMANAGPNTGGSQYFITLAPVTRLDGLGPNGEPKDCGADGVSCHAVFGKVIEGIDIVQAIGNVQTDGNDRPYEDVVIETLRILGIIYPRFELKQVTISDCPPNSDGDGVLNMLETGQIIVEVKNWASWRDAENTIGTLTCEDDRITITTGTVDFATIANGDSVSNVETPFEVTVNADESFTTHLNLQFIANPESEYPYEINYEIALNVSLNQLGWPLSYGSTSSALIIDIDNDDTNEVVFGDKDGLLHVVNGDGQSELAGFPVLTNSDISAAVAVDNLDQDDELEMVVSSRNGEITAVDHDGTILFNYATNGDMWGNPMIADVDGDDSMEIIGITFSGQVVVLNADGSDFGLFPVSIGSPVFSSPAIADLDGDNHLDIIAVTTSLHAISTLTGENLTGWPYPSVSISINGPIVADIDEDENPEILLGSNSDNFIALNHDGSELFRRYVGSDIKTSIVTEDINHDGIIEIIFISNDGRLYVIDPQNNDLPGFPLDLGVGIQSTPILADLNNNGTADIIFGDSNGYLQGIDINGSAIENLPLLIGGDLQTGPTIGNLDQDSDMEIAIPNSDSYFVIDYKQDADIAWHCFKRNPQRTGNAADLYTNILEEGKIISVVKKSYLSECYPNPFNPMATIRFGLAEASILSLGIYDVSGKLIRSLASGRWQAGAHQIEWNGRDDRGQMVRSGLYFYRLESEGFLDTKSMVLLK